MIVEMSLHGFSIRVAVSTHPQPSCAALRLDLPFFFLSCTLSFSVLVFLIGTRCSYLIEAACFQNTPQ